MSNSTLFTQRVCLGIAAIILAFVGLVSLMASLIFMLEVRGYEWLVFVLVASSRLGLIGVSFLTLLAVVAHITEIVFSYFINK